MKYEFHPDALGEYKEAALYCQVGLEQRFIMAVEHAIHQISESPKQWRIIDEDIRHCLTKVFPYAILFTIEAEFILIIAVMHCHREPGYWRNRLVQSTSRQLV